MNLSVLFFFEKRSFGLFLEVKEHIRRGKRLDIFAVKTYVLLQEHCYQNVLVSTMGHPILVHPASADGISSW